MRPSRFGFDRATLTLGHETFVGLAATAGVNIRQRINFSGRRSGRDQVSVAGDLALNTQLWGLPGGGFGYIYGTDHRLDGPFVDAQWGPLLFLHHPDYGNCVGMYFPGCAGLLLGREVVAAGAAVAIGIPGVRDGGYVFLRHPAVRLVTTPVFYIAARVAGLPLVERRVLRPVLVAARELKRIGRPLERAEQKLFAAGADALNRGFRRLGVGAPKLATDTSEARGSSSDRRTVGPDASPQPRQMPSPRTKAGRPEHRSTQAGTLRSSS